MSGLVAYDDSDEDSSMSSEQLDLPTTAPSSKSLVLVDPSPVVDITMISGAAAQNHQLLDLTSTKELSYNPKFEDMYRPELGPVDPSKPESVVSKNFLTGSLEPTFMAETTFEWQRKVFHAYGSACDPSDGAKTDEMVSKVRFTRYLY